MSKGHTEVMLPFKVFLCGNPNVYLAKYQYKLHGLYGFVLYGLWWQNTKLGRMNLAEEEVEQLLSKGNVTIRLTK